MLWSRYSGARATPALANGARVPGAYAVKAAACISGRTTTIVVSAGATSTVIVRLLQVRWNGPLPIRVSGSFRGWTLKIGVALWCSSLAEDEHFLDDKG